MAERLFWQSVYDCLWLKFKRSEFRFEDVLEAVYPGKKEFGIRGIKYASKIINKLEDEGYLIHTLAEYDKRVSIYSLIHPEKLTLAWAIYRQWALGKEPTFVTKIVEDAGKKAGWEYMYIKDSATWFWTKNYRSAEVWHLSVYREDADGWIALLKLFGHPVILNGKFVHEPKEKRQAVHLHTDLENREAQKREMHEHYQPVSYALAESFADNENLAAFAILLRNRENMDWDKVITAAENHGVINRLGFCMDALNRNASREIFTGDIVKKIEAYKKERPEKLSSPYGVSCLLSIYDDLEKKWNVECSDSASIDKAVLELV